MRKAAMFMVTGLALAVAGCGSSNSSSSTSTAAAAATSSSTASSSTPTSSAAAPATSGGADVHLSAVPGKLAFNTKALKAKAGTVTLTLSNPSSFPHGISIEGKGVDKDGKVVGNGGTSTVTTKLEPGTYTFYCPVPGHRAAGMQGTLTVS
ncbi:MAG: plastocyanin/azurin family copper-binding protein [Actinomycetota bacterium]|nr:plastocyanin/azurin family copper-binding protein [Actinomycetota bacterium]